MKSIVAVVIDIRVIPADIHITSPSCAKKAIQITEGFSAKKYQKSTDCDMKYDTRPVTVRAAAICI
jgi:hypothetical protein